MSIQSTKIKSSIDSKSCGFSTKKVSPTNLDADNTGRTSYSSQHHFTCGSPSCRKQTIQTKTNKQKLYLSHTFTTSGGIDIELFFCVLFFFSARFIRVVQQTTILGASRGFAFVEFNTEEEASRWMEYKQVPLCHLGATVQSKLNSIR